MSSAHHSLRVEVLFAEALERPMAERARYVEEACGDDVELRSEVNELLEAHEQAGAFLQSPVTPSSLGGHEQPPPVLTAGTMLGVFRITSQLGTGGMATVYAARDTRLARSVAIKVLTPGAELGEASRRRFEREALAISRLSHPHICALYDIGHARVSEAEGELSFLIMERVDGETLADLLTRGPLPMSRAVQFAVEIAEALICAHAEGIVHRDLKPQNIMVTKSGTKLLDFGLATFSAGAAALAGTPSVLTRPGIMVGTVQYMAPEQVQAVEADARADLFSLGLVLYEMVAGRRAFSRPTTVETLHAILHDDPPPVPEWTPAALKNVLSHCLEKDRNLRFQTARDVAFALRAFALSPAPERKRPEPRVRQGIAALGGTGLLLAGLMAAGRASHDGWDPGEYTLAPFAVDAAAESVPAWSPDGKSVAFVRSHATGEPQIVVRSSDSDVTTALTSDPSGVGRPFWSRDGSRIFFGGNPVRSVSVTGGEVRTEFHDVNAADVSSDGKTFALWRTTVAAERNSSSLWTGPRQGPFVRYEPAPFALNARNIPNVVRFSPDGSTILLSLAGGPSGIWLARYPPSSRPPTRVFQDRFREMQGVDWMPDSRHVVLSNNGALWIGDTQTGVCRRLLAGTTSALAPAVAPSGDRLLFDDAGESSLVVELSLSGGPPIALVGTSRHAGSGAWSPRGDRLAYVTDRRGVDEIWTRTREELSDQLLVKPDDFPDPAPNRIFSVRYSPNGERLSFATTAATADGEFRSRLWVVPARGGTPRPLTGENEGVVRASWAPDGRSLMTRLLRQQEMGIWEVSLDTGIPHRRVALPPDVHVWHTEWSPSGAWIAGVGWIRQRESGSTIVFARDGSQVRELPALGSPALLWSRDERTLYGVASINGQSVLRSLDVATGQVTTMAEYGRPLTLVEPINDTLQFMPTPGGRGFVTTSFERRYDIWMLNGLRLPRHSWWPWPWK